MKTLTLDGYSVGACSVDDFDLATEYLRDGVRPVQVVKLLRASSVDFAVQIVVNAARDLGVAIGYDFPSAMEGVESSRK
jgi:hypothetical protein